MERQNSLPPVNIDPWAKVREEPLVPIGAMVTAAVLIAGVISFKRGNKVMSQKMMRARVAAQGFTCAAIGYGTWVSQQKKMEQQNAIDTTLPATPVANAQ